MSNAALFVDFENLFWSLKSRNEGTGIRTRDLSLDILHGLLAKLREQATPMVMGRSYAAFDTYPGVEVAHDLALMGLDPQYVLVSHSGKNSADIQLSLDVARVLFRRSDIGQIIIVSGDRDFIPLARQVLEEGRELRVVSIPDTTSGDLRERVGADRFWNALDFSERLRQLDRRTAALGERRSEERVAPPTETRSESGPIVHEIPIEARRDTPVAAPAAVLEATTTTTTSTEPEPAAGAREEHGPVILGHIPVTWKTTRSVSPEEHEERLLHCLELMVRAQIRHASPDIWLSPFLKGPMSQHFTNLVHPERRALINDLRDRGVIRVEERDNMYADHPYSVIVIDDAHPMAQMARARVMRLGKTS